MDKLTIYIRRYKADIRINNRVIEERNPRTINEYTEEKSLMNVEDPGTLRNEFIRQMGARIYGVNSSAEAKAIRENGTTIEKLIIFNIK